MSDEKHRDDEASEADQTIEQPTLSVDATEENPILTMEAEHIGDSGSEARTEMAPLHESPDAAPPPASAEPPPLPPRSPDARDTRPPSPPLGTTGDEQGEKSGDWTGTRTMLYLALSGPGLHQGADPGVAEAAFLGDLREILGGHEILAGGGQVFCVPSPVKAARAAFELLDRLEAEGAPPERRVFARFGLARGPLGEAASASEAFRTAVDLGSGAEAGEILAAAVVVEHLGSEGVRAERVGKRAVEGLEELVVVHRLLYVDPTLALPVVAPPQQQPQKAPPPLGKGQQRLIFALTAIVAIGVGLLVGYLLK